MLAFGLTQYNLGAVVLTLNAKGSLEVLVNSKYSVDGSVKVPVVSIRTDTGSFECFPLQYG